MALRQRGYDSAHTHGQRGRTLIVPPVIVDAQGDVDFFASAEEAELYLEPWAANEGFAAYDGEGRLLELRGERRESPELFGLVTTEVDNVLLEAVEDEPHHAPQLRATLVTFLERAGLSLDSPEFVRRGVEHVGLTR